MTSDGGSYVYDEESKYEENGKKTGHFDSTDWTYRYTSDHSRKEFVKFMGDDITGFGGFYVPPPTSSWSVNETTTTLHGDHYFDMGTASGNTKTLSETSSTAPVVNNVPINPYRYGEWPPVKAYTPGTQHIQNPAIAAVVGGAEWLNGLVHTGATPVDRVLESLPMTPLDGPLTPLHRTTSTVTGLVSRGGQVLDKLVDDTQHGWGWKLGVVVGTLLGDAVGVTDVSDAWVGEDTNGEKLSDTEITARWLTGSAKLVLTAVGIKGAAGSVLRTGPIFGKPVQANLQFRGPGIGETPGGGPRYRSIYKDGKLVIDGEQPPRFGTFNPDPMATGPHSRVRLDTKNGRVYQLREFDGNGNPTRDIDFTNPTYPNGMPRPGHPGPPHQHSILPNDPRIGPPSGWRRSRTPDPLEN